jgi:hypothetical protein
MQILCSVTDEISGKTRTSVFTGFDGVHAELNHGAEIVMATQIRFINPVIEGARLFYLAAIKRADLVFVTKLKKISANQESAYLEFYTKKGDLTEAFASVVQNTK